MTDNLQQEIECLAIIRKDQMTIRLRNTSREPQLLHLIAEYEWAMNPNTREIERVLRYTECTAVIDTNQLEKYHTKSTKNGGIYSIIV